MSQSFSLSSQREHLGILRAGPRWRQPGEEQLLGEPGRVFLQLLLQFIILRFLSKCSMIFNICKWNVTQKMFLFFPNRSVRRCELGKGNSLWAELANKMSLVWVVFMEWSVHADVTSASSLGKYRRSGWCGCNSSFSFSTRCCRITQNMSNTGWKMSKFRGLNETHLQISTF